MNIQLTTARPADVETDILVIPVFEDDSRSAQDLAGLGPRASELLTELIDSGEVRGRMGDHYLVPRPEEMRARRVLFCGAGKSALYGRDEIRQLMTSTFAKLRHLKYDRVAIWPRVDKELADAASAALEGLIVASYDPAEYKTSRRPALKIKEFTVVAESDAGSKVIKRDMEKAVVLADCTNFARQLTNQPGNVVTPSVLARMAQEVAAEGKLSIEILDENKLKELGMNALLGVAMGSSAPPCMLILRYVPSAASDKSKNGVGPLALVGKAVTFDTGGISIKPSQAMEEMKADKAGGCAVLGALRAIATLKPDREVLGIIPAVENMPSGSAQRPGDVVKSFSGKTIEVINTDAEGRLILADALSYARHLGAAEIVDIATLTGACVIALGHVCAGLFSDHTSLRDRVLEAGARAGEKLWQLPLYDSYKKELSSDIADLKNSGSRYGGAIFAAKFLQEFVGDTPWAHLDIAGVDLYKDEGSPLKGASGFGVRTLAELCFL